MLAVLVVPVKAKVKAVLPARVKVAKARQVVQNKKPNALIMCQKNSGMQKQERPALKMRSNRIANLKANRVHPQKNLRHQSVKRLPVKSLKVYLKRQTNMNPKRLISDCLKDMKSR